MVEHDLAKCSGDMQKAQTYIVHICTDDGMREIFSRQ